MKSNKFESVILPIFILCILSILEGCSKTNFQIYDLKQVHHGNQKDGAWVFAHITGTPYYEKEAKLSIYKEPFSIYVTVHGPFEQIEQINARFLLNKNRDITLPQDVETINSQSGNTAKSNHFPIGKVSLDVPWEQIETLELLIDLIGVADGTRTPYKFRIPFDKKYKSYRAYPIWEAMMSV